MQAYTHQPQTYRAQSPRPPDQGQQRTLSDRHRRMLEVESGISPEMIAQRGYWTASTAADIPDGFAEYQYQAWMFPILVIPQWNTVGRLFAYILRPDNPRCDKDGKKIKYEAQPGAPVGFDCHPSMTHHLRDPSVPLYITEGSKKADAMASRGLLCLSLNGVYGFLHKRVVVSELDEIEMDRRRVLPAFDSDVTTKKEVADALDRLASAADRRGATVEIVHLPNGDDGSKVGLDDYFAAGGTPANLDILSKPWRAVRRPRNVIEYPDPYARIAHLEQQVSAQARLIKNPYLKEKERAVGFALITSAAAKKSRGDVGKDGLPRLSSSEIANDFRARPAKGESLAVTNNDGSLPITKRSDVRPVILKLRDAGILPVEIEATTRKHATGDTYADTDFAVDIEDAVAAIVKLADYRAEKQRKAYTRQEPCIHCGEIHARRVVTTSKTYCEGCGSQVAEDETSRIIPVPAANDPDATDDQRDDLKRRTASTNFVEAETDVYSSPSPPPSTYSSTKKVEATTATLITDPGPPAKAPPDSASTKFVERLGDGTLWPAGDFNACACGAPIPPGRKWTCSPDCDGTPPADRLEVAS
jgi:hypothetical protein